MAQDYLRTWLKRSANGVWNLIPARVHWHMLWMTQPKFNVGVTGVVFNPDRRVLLLNHVFRRTCPWGLPSGWLHSGETVADALKREVREEVSIDVSVDAMLEVISGLKLRLEVVFLCNTQATQVPHVSGEVFEAAFFDPAMLPEDVLPSHARYIEQVVA